MAANLKASSFELPLDTVHVWYLFTNRVSDQPVFDAYAAFLSAEERDRRDRFIFANDRRQFAVAHGFLRHLLSQYAHIKPEECVFGENRYGKPYLRHKGVARTALAFNMSHTKGLVAIAITIGRDVGIDVEETTRAPLDLDVCRFFSATEVSALEALPQVERRSRFFEYWTLKEAYIKARGMGLSLPLDGFSMYLETKQPPKIQFTPAIKDEASMWQFVQFAPSRRHRMALAIRRRGDDITIRIRKVSPIRSRRSCTSNDIRCG